METLTRKAVYALLAAGFTPNEVSRVVYDGDGQSEIITTAQAAACKAWNSPTLMAKRSK